MRFQLKDKFWEIARSGKQLTTIEGKLGTDG